MYYILTTYFKDHWDRVKNNRTSYLRRFLNIRESELINDTPTVFLRLTKGTNEIEAAWIGKVHDINVNGDNLNFSVSIEHEIPLEPELIRTKVGWYVIQGNLEFAPTPAPVPKGALHIQNLEGNWDYGWALDLHTVHSIMLSDGHFNTVRTQAGEYLYQLKYRNRKEYARIIASMSDEFFDNQLVSEILSSVEVIIPVPASDTTRSFQPVNELAIEFGNKLSISVDSDYIIKTRQTSQLKSEDDQFSRARLLAGAFDVKNLNYQNKNILVLDDLYRSGSTLKEITKTLREKGKAGKVYVLTITRTRTKR